MMINDIIFFINPFRTYNKIKKYFKPLKGFFYCRKSNKIPMIYWNDNYFIWANDVGWKDKFDSPRFEDHPCLFINIFGYSIGWIFAPYDLKQGNDISDYWEQALWYAYYYGNTSYGCLNSPDLEKAKESWPWTIVNNFESTNISSWNDKHLR